MNDAWLSEIRLSADKKTLNVTFEGGESMVLSAELLIHEQAEYRAMHLQSC